MDDSLGNALTCEGEWSASVDAESEALKGHTVKVSKLINQVKVLEQQRPHGAGALPCRRVVDGSTVGGGVHGLLVVPDGRGGGVVGDHCDRE
jgi:hypothetical protein